MSDWWFYMWLRREGYRIALPSWMVTLTKWCLALLFLVGFIYGFIIFQTVRQQALHERSNPSHVHTQPSH